MNREVVNELRGEPRSECDDVIRWKQPGRLEDDKGWSIDESPSGLGFLTSAKRAPSPGQSIHVRRLIEDRWTTIDRTIRVVRTTPTSNPSFVCVGCRIENPASPPADASPAADRLSPRALPWPRAKPFPSFRS